MKKIRVLIVDDSSVIRMMLDRFISSASDMEVVGTAPDAIIAKEKLAELKPDVMTLDVQMPKVDGLVFLKQVMETQPTKTLLISSFAKEGSDTALRALELGAIDVIEKPNLTVQKMEDVAALFIEKIRLVHQSRLVGKRTFLIAAKLPVITPINKKSHQVIAIASSTGGTEALKVLLAGLPADLPATLIVQHMPAGFTKTYAESLNKMFPFEVKEAADGDRLRQGLVLIAPGNFHMEMVRGPLGFQIRLHQESPLHGVRPAADFLMKTVAKYAGASSIGVVLTGMGKDGAEGLLAMHKAGAYTVTQSEKTCVVYGMPQAAFNLGASDKVLDLDKIANELISHFHKKAVA